MWISAIHDKEMLTYAYKWVLILYNIIIQYGNLMPYFMLVNNKEVRVMVLHFQQYFSYIVAVNFIGGGNQSNFIT